MSKFWGIILAGGAGTRFGDTPKQTIDLGGKPVLYHSVETALKTLDGVIVVLSETIYGEYKSDLSELGVDEIVVGGATRCESTRNGLSVLPDEAEVCLIHDAARPFASVQLFERVKQCSLTYDGVIPVIPISDTVKLIENSLVVKSVDRDKLFFAQTPQAFKASLLKQVHALMPEGTDDATLFENAGYKVYAVEGEELNGKITKKDDLELARAILSMKREDMCQ